MDGVKSDVGKGLRRVEKTRTLRRVFFFFFFFFLILAFSEYSLCIVNWREKDGLEIRQAMMARLQSSGDNVTVGYLNGAVIGPYTSARPSFAPSLRHRKTPAARA